MDNTDTTTAAIDQADEEILTYDVSDEALETTAGTERAPLLTYGGIVPPTIGCC
jgi:hypothetical protein